MWRKIRRKRPRSQHHTRHTKSQLPRSLFLPSRLTLSCLYLILFRPLLSSSCLFLFRLILPYLVLSSYLILSYLILSYLILSCLSCLVAILSCRFLVSSFVLSFVLTLIFSSGKEKETKKHRAPTQISHAWTQSAPKAKAGVYWRYVLDSH